jgi:hypothetical protein
MTTIWSIGILATPALGRKFAIVLDFISWHRIG